MSCCDSDTEAICPCATFAHPRVIFNPPGRDAIAYRVGDYTTFRHALLQALHGETELSQTDDARIGGPRARSEQADTNTEHDADRQVDRARRSDGVQHERHNGEERTDGVTPTAGTAKCDSWYTAHGLAPTYQQPPLAGNACNQLWMLKAAVENAPALAVDTLADGLRQSGSIDFSYPQGPNDFSQDGVTTGGQFWRTAQFFTDCACWKLIEPDFHPTYG